MFDNKNGILGLFCLVCFFAITGCASVTPVKDVTADKMGYLSKKFSAQSVNADIAKKIPSDGKSIENFRELKVSLNVETEFSDGKKDASVATVKYVPAGSGLIQRLYEYSRNDIPYMLLYSITYKGIVSIKWQSVPLQGSSTSLMYELKKITRFDIAPVNAGQEFTVDYTSGAEPQLGGFAQAQQVCKAIKVSAANTINAKLQGHAIDLDCESHVNGAVSSRTQLVFLKEYDAAILLSSTTNSSKTTYKITAIDIDS